MKHFGDITKISGYDLPIVDIITGGSPCQDLSVMGKRAGLAGERSGLFMEQIRIIKEMREHDRANTRANEHIRPRYMVWENVPGAFSSNNGEDFRAVLEETAKVADENAVIPRLEGGRWTPSGCILGDGWSISWRVHDAQFWGVPQRRKRIALVADFGGHAAPEILFERKSLSGDFTQSRNERKDAAADIGANIKETRKCYNGWDVQSKHIQPENGIAESLYAGECRYGGGESYVAQSVNQLSGESGQTRGGKGLLIQNERTGALSTVNNQSVVYGMSSFGSNAMLSGNPNSGIYQADTARTLDNNGANPACNQGGMMVLCDAFQHHGYRESKTCGTLTADQNTSVRGDTPIVLEGNGSRPSHRGSGYVESQTMFTLNSTEQHAVCIGNGQLNQISMREQANTLDAMHDQQAIITYGLDRASFNQGQNAQYDFSVEQELAQTLVSRGPGGVLAKK